MIELLVIGGLCLVGLFLCFLILIPLMLVGAVIKLVFGLLLLPFRLLGFAVGAGVSVVALLFKGLFGILASSRASRCSSSEWPCFRWGCSCWPSWQPRS